MLYFLFKRFYLPSQQNSHTRWWVTYLYNSPGLLGSSGGKRIHCKRFLMLFFSSLAMLKTRNLKELWVSICAKLRVHSGPHFHWPRVLPNSSSWQLASRAFLLPLMQWPNHGLLQNSAFSEKLYMPYINSGGAEITTSKTGHSTGARTCLPRLMQLHCRPGGPVCVLRRWRAKRAVLRYPQSSAYCTSGIICSNSCCSSFKNLHLNLNCITPANPALTHLLHA